MSVRNGILMTVGLVCLGLFLLYDEVGGLLNAKAAIDADEIRTVEVRRPGGRFTLNRVDGRWEFEVPAHAPADQLEVRKLMQNALVPQIKAGFRAADAPQGLAVYGLAEPELELELTGENKHATLRFGKLNTLTKRRYTVVEGLGFDSTGFVFLIPETQFTILNKAFDDLRDRYPLKLDPKIITSLRVERPGHVTMLVRGERGGWTLFDRDRQYRADAPAAQDLLVRLVSLRVEAFADKFTKGSESAYGLDDPVLTVSIGIYPSPPVPVGTLKNPDASGMKSSNTDRPGLQIDGLSAKWFSFHVGRVLASGGPTPVNEEAEQALTAGLARRYYFRVAETPWVYQAPLAGPIDDLLKEPFFLRERAPFSLLTEISRLRLKLPDGPSYLLERLKSGALSVRRDDTEWSVKADQVQRELRQLLNAIRALSYTGVATEGLVDNPGDTLIEVYDIDDRYCRTIISNSLNASAQSPHPNAPHEGIVLMEGEEAMQAVFGADTIDAVRALAVKIDQTMSQGLLQAGENNS